jgi:serine/threonine-protein kinase HipA
MSLPEIKYCPGTLAEGFDTYSKNCIKKMFNGKKVSHFLPYFPARISEIDAEKFFDNRKRISVSGVQEKLSLILDKNELRLTNEGERGNYILKPIPHDLLKTDQVPANEHLTMQIASQVFGIQTAENALVFFKNGEPAYLTRRFDIKPDGTHWGKEDFATLAGKTAENTGLDFKYKTSYEEMAGLIRKFIPTYRIEMEKFFTIVAFNFLFSNGDAHLKNFSVLESERGDYRLSPAYDLINTRLHVPDTDFALDNGLFVDNYQSERKKNTGKTGLDDFIEFANRLEINENRRNKILERFLQKQPLVEVLIQHSYLSESSKRTYLLLYQTKKNQLTSGMK